MRPHDYTDMGGNSETFLTTHWSLIENVNSEDSDKNRALLGLLLSKYWKPVYCYLRRKGYNNEKAKDLTQQFFYEAVFGRGLIQKADESKGRFRSFLLIALNRFLINIKHKETAQKRIPKDKLIPLEMVDSLELPQAILSSVPEDSFNYAWVSSLVEDVLEEVEAKCHADGKSIHWQVFCDRILQPIIDGTDPPSLKEICKRYGINDDAKSSNMIVTVKRRFQAALKKQLRDSVVSEDQLSGELEEIKRFFPKIAQDSE
ncbi:MAG: RNA polymerase sigma factor [Planctomycetota bacterium]